MGISFRVCHAVYQSFGLQPRILTCRDGLGDPGSSSGRLPGCVGLGQARAVTAGIKCTDNVKKTVSGRSSVDRCTDRSRHMFIFSSSDAVSGLCCQCMDPDLL